MTIESRHTESPEQRPAKKRYQAPRLRVYGNIREITQALGSTGPTKDGQGGGAMGFKSIA